MARILAVVLTAVIVAEVRLSLPVSVPLRLNILEANIFQKIPIE